ncbi:pre-mRNA 3'-end-processing factor FIP1-like isoform X1 [Colossoma macropomum]|uniref:pre-mRNA 3'-end-processing factor FIP1-like isoform X1 n=1 Tax=Colossoma macropomum TaxID=42526 RepID=UPI0018643086|nr:pre-mRNA 3'-end-processing factor FIP1-like isoform X1 [Colossoma macropomum]
MATAAAESEQVEDEEHWLYGDENSKNQAVNDETRETEPAPESSNSTEEKNDTEQAAKSAEDEEEEDSDSDDEDDVKVTIGNIKTGAPAYMGSGMNLSIKPVRGYGVAATNKLQCKGVDMESLSGFNGLHAVEAEADTYEDKPWRKPGADLSDYFNYGFNEETWKAYCEKQRRLQLGLDPCLPPSFENKITVQQGRTVSLEKEAENSTVKLDFKTDFSTQAITASSRLKAGPPPNRKMGGTIDVIGGQTGAIRRVEGRRREIPEQNPIQVLGDHGNKTQPLTPPTAPPPLPPIGVPPPHFLHRPPPVSGMPPPMQPPGIPPPALPGMFPPPLVPPPNLMMPPVNSRCPSSGYANRAPPPFGYSSGEPNFISYPPVSSSHMQWGGVMEKSAGGGGGGGGGGHWEHSRREREREREREMDRERETERRERTPTTNEYIEEERYRYYARESEREYERFHHPRASSRGREEHTGRERRHREKEESGKHKSSKRKQHDDDGDGHRRHKHKKNKRSKEERAAEDAGGPGDEHEHKD